MNEPMSHPRVGLDAHVTVVLLLAGLSFGGLPAWGVLAGEEGTERAAFEAELAAIDRQIFSALGALERSPVSELTSTPSPLAGETPGLIDDLSRRLASLETVVPQDLASKVVALRSLLEVLRQVMAGEAATPAGALRLPESGDVTWLGAEGVAVPPNDACASAMVVGKGSFAGDTSLATNDAAVPCGGSSTSPDVWFRYEGTESEFVLFDTIGSSYDTVLSLHQSCEDAASLSLACNDDAFGLQSLVFQNRFFWFDPVWIRVSGFNGASGPFVLNVGNGGAVSGRVTDAATGDPLAGVGVVARLEENIMIGSGTTGSDGRYTIAGLFPEEELFVLAEASGGYLNELYDDVPCTLDGCDFSSATPFTILNGDTASGVDFALELGGRITGTVVRSGTGEVLVDVQVKVFDSQGRARGASNSDDSGVYAVGGLTAGSYFVVADQYVPFGPGGPPVVPELYDDIVCSGGPPAGCDVTTGTPVAVSVRQTTAGIDFVLDLEGRVGGVVTESGTGDPASGILVEVVDATGARLTSGFTDETGLYETGSLESGAYYVATASSNRYLDELYDDVPCPGGVGSGCQPGDGATVSVTANVTTPGIDFVLVPRGAIGGTLTEEGSGDPLPFVRVQLWREDARPVRGVETDAAGAYLFDGLNAGAYLVTTESEHHINELYDDVPCRFGDLDLCGAAGGTLLAVTDGVVVGGVDFALRRKGVIAGTVTEQSNGMPLVDVHVGFWDELGSTQLGFARTDSVGEYSIELLPGTYFVTAGSSFRQPLVAEEVYDDVQCPGGDCDPAAGTPVVVVADATSGGIDFALQKLGTLSGTVVAANTGEPIFGARVDVDGPDYEGSVVTDFAGSYSFDGLVDGSYFVSARALQAGFRDEVFDDVPCSAYVVFDPCELETGTPVAVVNDTATTGIDFALNRLGAISGRVTHQASGAPISSVGIYAYLADGSQARSTFTDEEGRYTLEWLSHGPLYVVADKRGLFEELWQELPCPGGVPQGCEASAGVPIPVVLDGETTGIDFTLEDKGTIVGRVTDAATGSPLPGAQVFVLDENGNSRRSATADAFGRWTADDLLAGTHFLLIRGPISTSYVSEIYDDIACGASCDVTKGTPIVVSRGGFISGIDISLEGHSLSPTVLGSVRDADSEEPVAGVIVDVWRSPGGGRVASAITSSDGTFEIDLSSTSTHYFSTDSGFLFVDEVYDDRPCSRGPAALGLCDPMTGDPVVLELDAPPVRIDFELRKAALFADGFESGLLVSWSSATAGP